MNPPVICCCSFFALPRFSPVLLYRSGRIPRVCAKRRRVPAERATRSAACRSARKICNWVGSYAMNGLGPVAQWSELAAHNRLVGGSSPPGPTTQPRAGGDFLRKREKPAIGGLSSATKVSVRAGGSLRTGLGVWSLVLKFAFPGNRRLGSRKRGSRLPLSAAGGQASCAAVTIPPAGRRGEQRPCRVEVCHRWRL